MSKINIFEPIKVRSELYRFCRRQTIFLETDDQYEAFIEMAAQRKLSIDGCATEIVCRKLAEDPQYSAMCRMAANLLKVLPEAHFHGDPIREKERIPQQRKTRKANRIAASLPVPINTIALLLAYSYGISLKRYLEKLVIQEIQEIQASEINDASVV